MDKNNFTQSQKLLDKVLSCIVKIDDLSNITEAELLEMSGVSEIDYYNA